MLKLFRPDDSDDYHETRQFLVNRLREKLDLSQVGDLAYSALRREIRLVVQRLYELKGGNLNPVHRDFLFNDVINEVLGQRQEADLFDGH